MVNYIKISINGKIHKNIDENRFLELLEKEMV